MKKSFTSQYKATVALAALKGEKTINQLSSIYQVHPTQIHAWKRTLKDNLCSVFTDKRTKQAKSKDQLIDELHRVIGKKDAELEWLKKKLML